jgi:hypothetical protein
VKNREKSRSIFNVFIRNNGLRAKEEAFLKAEKYVSIHDVQKRRVFLMEF